MAVPGRRGVAFVAVAAALAGSLAACGSTSDNASGGTQPVIKVVAFKSPSLGAFLPAVIKDRKLDAKNGLDLQFTYATPDNYNSEFGAGHYDVGGSAAVLSEALRTQRGADVTYLFNLFDFYGTVVTSDSAIKGLGDLKGHTLAAATGTTNYAMFAWFAKQASLDLKGVQTQNQTTAGLSTMAQTGRTDATQLWEPAYSTLVAKKPGIRTIDLDYGAWNSEFGTSEIPYLGVAAQSSWAKKNPDKVQALYQTYKDAAAWVTANPKEAAAVIAKTIPGGDVKVVQELIEANDKRLRMHVTPASAVSDGMKAVFKAGQQTGYLTKQPPDSVIYAGLK
jgi:ABC-type nitrate/sulfonate/bicarbonate transport system substrate-binding protein